MSTTLNELSDAYIDAAIAKLKTEIQMKPPVARSPPTKKSAEKSEKPVETGNLAKIDNLPWQIELRFF